MLSVTSDVAVDKTVTAKQHAAADIISLFVRSTNASLLFPAVRQAVE